MTRIASVPALGLVAALFTAPAAMAQDAALAAFDAFCVANIEDYDGIGRAAAAAGWAPVDLTGEIAADDPGQYRDWTSPDGSGLELWTSFHPGQEADAPHVLDCSVVGGPLDRVSSRVAHLEERFGYSGDPTWNGHSWLISDSEPYRSVEDVLHVGGPGMLTEYGVDEGYLIVSADEMDGKARLSLSRRFR